MAGQVSNTGSETGTRDLTLLFLLSTSVLWIAPLMIGHEPWLDEGYGFSIIYNILLTGDPVVPTMAGLPFMEKPPLYYSLAALSAKVLSPWLPLHDGARLINTLFTGICLTAMVAAGRRLYDRQTSLYTALLLIACVGLWDAFHRIITDVAMLSGHCLALAGLVWADRKPLTAVSGWAPAQALHSMSKGLLGPGMLGMSALLLPLVAASYRTRDYVHVLLIAGLSALPWILIWPTLLYLRSPELFMEWFWVNNFDRFIGESGLGPEEQFGFYLTTLVWQAWPALPLCLWAWAQQYRKTRSRLSPTSIRAADLLTLSCLLLTAVSFYFQVNKVYTLPLIGWLLWVVFQSERSRHNATSAATVCFATTLLILSLAGTSTEIYAMPLLPPLALLAPFAFSDFPTTLAKWLDRGGLVLLGLLVAVLWIAWAIPLLGWPPGLSERLLDPAPDFEPGFSIRAFLVSLLATIAGLVLWMNSSPDPRGWVTRWLGGIVVIGILLGSLWPSAIDSTLSYRAVFKSLQQAMPENYDCVAGQWVGESFRGMLQYRTGITLVDTEHSGQPELADCQLRLLREYDLALAPESEWVLLWEGGRTGDRRRFHLFARRDSIGGIVDPERPATPAGPGDQALDSFRQLALPAAPAAADRTMRRRSDTATDR